MVGDLRNGNLRLNRGDTLEMGGDTLGAAGKVPDIGTIMHQGKQRNGESGIPSIARTLRQGGGKIK